MSRGEATARAETLVVSAGLGFGKEGTLISKNHPIMMGNFVILSSSIPAASALLARYASSPIQRNLVNDPRRFNAGMSPKPGLRSIAQFDPDIQVSTAYIYNPGSSFLLLVNASTPGSLIREIVAMYYLLPLTSTIFRFQEPLWIQRGITKTFSCDTAEKLFLFWPIHLTILVTKAELHMNLLFRG
jgi:hypothetical protein